MRWSSINFSPISAAASGGAFLQALGIDDAVGKVFVFGFYYLFLDVYFAGALGYFGFEGEHGVASVVAFVCVLVFSVLLHALISRHSVISSMPLKIVCFFICSVCLVN